MYNRKVFLAEDSINSMSAIHCKAYDNDGGQYAGKAVVRISDCHNSIRLWNEITTASGRAEMIHKVDTIINQLNDFQTFLKEIDNAEETHDIILEKRI